MELWNSSTCVLKSGSQSTIPSSSKQILRIRLSHFQLDSKENREIYTDRICLQRTAHEALSEKREGNAFIFFFVVALTSQLYKRGMDSCPKVSSAKLTFENGLSSIAAFVYM